MKQKSDSHISYVYLAVLALLAAAVLELLSDKVELLMIPELTRNVVVSLLYVVSGIMLTAFIASVKLVNEQKYILYLVVLALVFFRVYSLTGNTI